MEYDTNSQLPRSVASSGTFLRCQERRVLNYRARVAVYTRIVLERVVIKVERRDLSNE